MTDATAKKLETLRRQLGIGLLVAFAYVAAAKLGFRAAFVAEQVTTVWAPTGIAQAALLLWGLKYWPAVWLGAFVANATTHEPFGVAAGIATGNTLEAVVAAWALTRMLGFDLALTRARDAVAFICVAVATSTMLSATVGAAMLCAGGLQPWSRYWDLWPDWWLGDALGSLIVAPALLTTLRARSPRTRRQVWETVGWVSAAMATTAIVFGGSLIPNAGRLPFAFTIFPFVIVAAVRLGQPATALVIAGTAGMTLWNATHGSGPFMESPLHQRLILIQIFMGVLGGSGLLLAAAITERRVIERRRSATYRVGEALGHSSNLEQAAPRILSAIGGTLAWDVGALWLVDRARNDLGCVEVWSAEGNIAPTFTRLTSGARFQHGVGLPGRVWATGQATWIQNVVEDDNFPRAAVARQEGLHGAFAFPIRLGDELLGVVEFFNRSISSPDDDLLTMMGAMGNDIGQFIRRKSIEAAAVESERRTHAMLESAQDAIISMDHRGMITEFNAAAERMFGRRRDDVHGREMADIIIPEPLRERHRRGLAVYLQTGEGPFIDRRIEATALRADGREFPVEISITSVPTEPPIFTGFIRDTTERVEAERERRRLLEQALGARLEAEEANRAKDEFLATLSHELRTPLNAIVGWTSMLLDGTLDGRTSRRALEIIDRNAQTQMKLVADILEVSRIITGKLRLDIRPVDLGTIIGVVLDGVRPAADAKQIRIHSTLMPSARLTAGDPQRLQQVVWNLIANAMKFTPQGGTISVDLADSGRASVCIRVTDTGVGIAPEFLRHVFERFRQADSSSTRQHGGLGLGLAIVRHLVELHGGTVRAESEGPGKGATFVVELPRMMDDEATPWQPAKAESVEALPAVQEHPLSGCRVLVVEDDEDARELLTAMLTQFGATVESAPSVEEALDVLGRGRPDVLVSDIAFPARDGYALIREIRAFETSGIPRLPAAAVTAYARQEDYDKAIGAGFDRYLSKPIQARTMIETVLELWKTGRP